MLAGKYVNVMRECGVDIEASPMGDGDDADWQLDSERLVITAYYLPGTDRTHLYRFYKGVEDAYAYANRTLLKLLIDDQELLPRLR